MLDSRHPARTVPAVTSSVKITQLLAGVFKEERELTVGGIVDAIEDRGFGFLLLVLALRRSCQFFLQGLRRSSGFCTFLWRCKCGPVLNARGFRSVFVPPEFPQHIVPKLRESGLRVFGQI